MLNRHGLVAGATGTGKTVTLQQLRIGEDRAPESLMAPTPADQLARGVAMSALQNKYGQAIDRDSAREILARKLEAGALAEQEAADSDAAEEAERQRAKEASSGRPGDLPGHLRDRSPALTGGVGIPVRVAL